MIPNKFEKDYDIEGFERRRPVQMPAEPVQMPAVPPVVEEIIELSSDDDDEPNRPPITQIKREQSREQIDEIDENDDQSFAVPKLSKENVISEPVCQSDQAAQKTPVSGHGCQIPESLGHTSIVSNGIVNYSYSSDDDFQLDLAQPNQHVRTPNMSTPKVQFRMQAPNRNPIKPEGETNRNASEMPLENLQENLLPTDDTTQMVPDTTGQNYSSMNSSPENEQFATENSFRSSFATNSNANDLFLPQTTPTMYQTHVHMPHTTPSVDFSGDMNSKHGYADNYGMNNTGQYSFHNPMNNVHLGSASNTPVYAFEGSIGIAEPIKEIVKEEVAKKYEEKEQSIQKYMDEAEERLMKRFKAEGYVMVPKSEYDSLKKKRDSDYAHHTTKDGGRKRRSSSPPKRSANAAKKRHKSSQHSDRESRQHPSTSKNSHSHGYHRSTSTSSKSDQSTHKTSTVTSGSYQPFQDDPNTSQTDYQNDSSSVSSFDSNFFIEKETKPRTPGMQFKIKTLFEKGPGGSWGIHRPHNKVPEPTTPQTVAKNIDSSHYLKNVKRCPFCRKPYQRMVVHMKNQHPEEEVYVSRISLKMAKLAKHGSKTAVWHKHQGIKHLKAMCFFCEEEKNFIPQYWNDHIRSHTGEYGRECDLCQKEVCFSHHCGNPTTVIDIFDIYNKDMCAYICQKCNFVQIELKNMEAHLRKQHEINDGELRKHWKKITLLPSLNSLPLTILDGTTSNGAYQSNLNRYYGKATVTQPQTQTAYSQPSASGITVLENRVIRPAVDDTTSATESEAENMDINIGETAATNNTAQPTENVYKIDPQAEEALMNAYQNYDQNLEYNHKVRPWLDDYAKKPTLYLMTQFSLFKCMHPKCLFATNDEDKWQVHMSKHIDMFDILTKRNQNQILQKTIREKLIKFRECPYCHYQAKADHQFMSHMVDHCRNTYQCAHCFYRSLEMDNMVLHHKKYHSDLGREILLCNAEARFGDNDEDQIKDNLVENVKKMRCGQDACSEEYACFNSYYAHLVVCHAISENNHYTCPYCMADAGSAESNIRNHLKSCEKKEHKISEFHCIYCENEGFENIEDIREHMSENHASNFLFIAARHSEKPEEDGGDESVAQIVYIGNSQDADFTLYECSNPEKLEFMDAAELNVSTQFKVLKLNQFEVIKNPVTKKMISVVDQINGQRNDFSYITLGLYKQMIKSDQRCTSQNVQSASHAVSFGQNATTTQRKPSLEMPIPERKASIIKSELRNGSYDPQLLAKPVAPQPSTQPTITYKCITTVMAKELEVILDSSYKSLTCKNCNKFIAGLFTLIDHLWDECPSRKCTESHSIEKILVQHRIKNHKDDEIVYLQEEKTADTKVYKLVWCKIHCRGPLKCDKQFGNVPSLRKHHQQHSERFLRSVIKQRIIVIRSNDPKQPVQSTTTEHDLFELNNLFWCNRENRHVGTRLDALEHHNTHYPKHNFEFSTKTLLVEPELRDNDDHKLHVLECEHCSKFFGSKDSVEAHINAIRSDNPHTAVYTVKRLVACRECKVISTLHGLESHYSAKHPGKECIPMHPLHPGWCGLCRQEDKDPVKHYKVAHKRGEVVGNMLLRPLVSDDFDLKKCKFAQACCDGYRFDTMEQAMQHVAICQHRLRCTDCPDHASFQDLAELAKHRKSVHNDDISKILHYVHNIKTFMRLLDNLKIFFPTGFVVTKNAIEDTRLGGRLINLIGQSINTVFNREKEWIETIPLLQD